MPDATEETSFRSSATFGSSAEEFLARHARPDEPPVLADGTLIDGWRVAAFLGRGGSGEVYRVIGRDVTAAPQAAVFKGMGSLSKAMGGPGISTMFFVKPGTTCPAGSTSFQMGFALVKISSTL